MFDRVISSLCSRAGKFAATNRILIARNAVRNINCPIERTAIVSKRLHEAATNYRIIPEVLAKAAEKGAATSENMSPVFATLSYAPFLNTLESSLLDVFPHACESLKMGSSEYYSAYAKHLRAASLKEQRGVRNLGIA